MIAILGATGYIGSSLAREFVSRGLTNLSLFARDAKKLKLQTWPSTVRCASLQDFEPQAFDLIVSAIGVGDPARVAATGPAILELTNHWDDLVLSGMTDQAQYVFLSSGAIYGSGFSRPVTESDSLCIPVNSIESLPLYTLAKLYAEAKHRIHSSRSILDIRIFGYADEAISHQGRFFLSELVRSVASQSTFETSTEDMIRDYAGRIELADLIEAWQSSGAPNLAADLFTMKPLVKSELLKEIRLRYNIEIRAISGDFVVPTGTKNVYASANYIARKLGYAPRRSSMDVVLTMLENSVDGAEIKN